MTSTSTVKVKVIADILHREGVWYKSAEVQELPKSVYDDFAKALKKDGSMVYFEGVPKAPKKATPAKK